MNASPVTRYSLIGKLRDSQDAEAWNEFTSIYQPLVFRVCLSKGLQYADATDVTQDVLARVAEAIDGFDPSRENATFRGWLYRVTRNFVIDFFRDQKRNPLASAGTSQLLDERAICDESAEFEIEYQRQVFWAAAKLVRQQVQPLTWQAFWLTAIEHKPVAAVAAELDIKPGAVYMARSRIFARLKTLVEKQLAASAERGA